MRVYIAGPMTGYKDFNKPAFDSVERRLLEQGHEVFNPSEEDAGITYRDAMKKDVAWICDKAEAIYMLPGWEFSPGACTEHALAKALRLKIMYWSAP